MSPELQLFLTRGFQRLPLIWGKTGMDVRPYCWEQRGLVSWGWEISSPASLVYLDFHPILFPRKTSMPEMAVCGKNKGVLVVHRHISPQDTFQGIAQGRAWAKGILEFAGKKKNQNKTNLAAFLKMDLGEDSAWVSQHQAKPSTHRSVPLLMIWIFQRRSGMSAGASRGKKQDKISSQNKLSGERVSSGARFIEGQV